MRFRKLRIAWSAICGIASVLLIILWVRSYWCHDALSRSSTSEATGGASVTGTLYLSHIQLAPGQGAVGWNYGTSEAALEYGGFKWEPSRDLISIPHWFFILTFAALATTPWIRWRFTTRSLLVATTLVAVVLGAIVYAVR